MKIKFLLSLAFSVAVFGSSCGSENGSGNGKKPNNNSCIEGDGLSSDQKQELRNLVSQNKGNKEAMKNFLTNNGIAFDASKKDQIVECLQERKKNRSGE